MKELKKEATFEQNDSFEEELQNDNNRKNKEKLLTNDIITDFFSTLDYIPLSPRKEKQWIKKSQLSFYDDVDDNLKQKFLENYAEEDLRFAREYLKACADNNEDEKEKLLEEAILKSKECRDWFLGNNQRLILSVARMYFQRCEKMTIADLLQEGNLGIMKALEKYDVDQNHKFSTYAIHWIKQSISRAINNKDAAIRQPVHFYGKVRKVNQVRNDLYQKSSKEPTIKELSEATGLTPSQIYEIQKYEFSKVNLPSLDTPLSESQGMTIGDFICSDENIEELVSEKSVSDTLMEVLNSGILTDRELQIIYRRFGFDYYNVTTLNEVGKIVGVTRERVRQIEQAVLKKLSKNETLKALYPEKFKLLTLTRKN